MYPYYSYGGFEQEELARRAERQRFIRELADQIVLRERRLFRMLRRLGAPGSRSRASGRSSCRRGGDLAT